MPEKRRRYISLEIEIIRAKIESLIFKIADEEDLLKEKDLLENASLLLLTAMDELRR